MPLRSFAPFLTCLILISTLLFLSSPLEGDHLTEEHQPHESQTPFRSWFSFNGPSALFAPVALISLTDDNSTYFSARPAAFGPLLPVSGLSAPVWAGDGDTWSDSEAEFSVVDSGELGCGDVPGWPSTQQRSNSSSSRQYSVQSIASQHRNRAEDENTELSQPFLNSAERRVPPTSDYNVSEIEGKIVLLSRGGCGFLEKVLWAQARGAHAVIVGDNLSGGPLVTMYAKGDTSNVSIPSIFTSHMTAHLLSSLVPRAPAIETHSEFHQELWVTLSMTSVSNNPFFNTLFVLVVSPLITLAIVYVMLLVRARIRRRRWRAPKSVVDRLPVRIYRVLSSRTSPPATEPTSPTMPTATTPLLRIDRPHQNVPDHHPDPDHDTVPGSSYGSTQSFSAPTTEKSIQAISRPRPKYSRKQSECAVCLEEYEDGISRVMSLPCGHDFHADCVTPWLTTKRRTCPICKGDVVRSLGADEEEAASTPNSLRDSTDEQDEIAQTVSRSPEAEMPLVLRQEEISELEADLERGTRSRDRR